MWRSAGRGGRSFSNLVRARSQLRRPSPAADCWANDPTDSSDEEGQGAGIGGRDSGPLFRNVLPTARNRNARETRLLE
jgi:hypothetical protein